MKRLLLLCGGIGILMTGCGGGGPSLPANYGSEEEPLAAIGAAGDLTESTATCIEQVDEETEEISYVYYGMTYCGRTVQDYVNALIQNYDCDVVDTDTGYYVSELPEGVGENEPISPRGEVPEDSETSEDAKEEDTEETKDASTTQLGATVGNLMSDKETEETSEEASAEETEETTQEEPEEEESEEIPYVPIAPTGMFAQPVGTITVAKELEDGINRLEVTIQWTETACTVTTEVAEIPPTPTEKIEMVQALSTSDAVGRIEGLVQEQLGLTDEEAAHCNAYAQDGYVMVDGNVCFRIGVYDEINRSILRTYLLSVDGMSLYYLDDETDYAIPITNA